jgi:transposase
MNKFSKYVGLDVHKSTLAVSIADANDGAIRFYGEIANTAEAIAKLVAQLAKGGAKLSFCYEAGCCGYVIYRQLTKLGQACQVVAPSLIPKKAGDRVKTDRRDSLMLARLLRAGELTGIWVPDGMQEALRDLTRAREDMKHLQRQSKQQLLGFLLRHGVSGFAGKSNWTQAHFRWFETIKFDQPAQQIVFQEYIDTIIASIKRVQGLDQHIERTAQASAVWPIIEALMALRGVSLLAAATVMAEVGDLTRFTNASQLMAYLGLVPSESSSGPNTRRGGITKTGNSHVRRVLVEAAWTYRHPARKTATLQRRAEKTSGEVQDIAWKAQQRLCARYWALDARGKLKVQACTAVARELAGFVWAIGQAMPSISKAATAV